MTPIQIHCTVNGRERRILAEPCKTLLELLRDDTGLLSVKEGCGQGDCGACVVVMDGRAVNACLVLAAQAEGTTIVTVEGLADGDVLHPLQRHFVKRWAFQCGYCTPGMLMACYALLLANPEPSDAEVRVAIAGNLCRCTSYQGVVEATIAAARDLCMGEVESRPV